MTRACGVEIFNCKAEIEEILGNIKKAETESFIGDGESFVVRVRRVRGTSAEIDGLALERKIGEIILKKVAGARVDLKDSQKTFLGILTDGRFVFGLKKAEIKARSFIKRGPRRKVFFHAAAIPVKLARCMVNLAQPKTGDLVLDPFCGTGTFLVEAGLMGCRVLGFDVKRNMVEGSLRNLSLYGIEPEGMTIADARFLPLTKASVDCIVTDPPYGTSATTLGLDIRDVFKGFLSTASNFIGRGRRVCLAAPKIVKVSEIGERLGFKHLESHHIYVHRSLTREIAVFRRE
jgi:tRNA (guanine10-N2)-dimethyltransferase